MCRAMEELINEEIKENNIAMAMRMLEDGRLSVEEIAKYVGLSVEEVNALSKELGSV